MKLNVGDKVSYRWIVRERRNSDLDDVYVTDVGVIIGFSETGKTARVLFTKGTKSGSKWVPLGRLTKEEI